jgi:hypothetical protein
MVSVWRADTKDTLPTDTTNVFCSSAVLKLIIPLPDFHVARARGESDNGGFLVKVKLEVENIVRGYTCAEHDACIKSLPNWDRLNRVFKMAGIAYTSRPQPSTEASVEAARKRNVDAYDKPTGKRAEVAANRMATSVKAILPKAKSNVK